jgi:hypothetical protein
MEMNGSSAHQVVEILPYLQIMPIENYLENRVATGINQII